MADIDESASDRRRLGLRAEREAPDRGEQRQRIHRRRRRASVLDPQGQGGHQRHGAGERGVDCTRCGRPCRGHRAEPQAPRLSARPAQRNGARQGHAPSALQGRRHIRRQGLRRRRRLDLARLRPAGRSPSRGPNSTSGSAIAPRQAVCRRKGFRRTTGSRGREGRMAYIGRRFDARLFGQEPRVNRQAFAPSTRDFDFYLRDPR